jgi:hypothetical protein
MKIKANILISDENSKAFVCHAQTLGINIKHKEEITGIFGKDCRYTVECEGEKLYAIGNLIGKLNPKIK